MTAFRIAAVGDNCIDEFAAPFNKSLIGGNALNVAVQLRRLGHASYYFGMTGQDSNGDRVRNTLATWNVDQSYAKVGNGATGRTIISVDGSGERTIEFEDFGVCALYVPSEEDIKILLSMDHVHLGWIADGGRLRKRLTSANVSVSQDISVNADFNDIQVKGLSVAFSSAGSSRIEALRVADRLLEDGARVAAVTMGEVGSLAKSGIEFFETGIEPVKVVDTTGAGDSFVAGFLSGYLVEGSLMDGLNRGRICSALTCKHLGGFPQDIPPSG